MTIEQFCDKHRACAEGREWALTNCKDMNKVWQTAKLDWLTWVATREGVLTDKELRLFAVWSARQVQHLMTDKRSLDALDVAERYANNEASKEELAAALVAAGDAASDATGDAAWAAARAAWAAARDAAWDASAVASAAARSAASEAASDAVSAAQAQWLRENTKPNFK